MKTNQFHRIAIAVLVALLAGSVSSWAWRFVYRHSDTGDNYVYNFNCDQLTYDGWYAESMDYFRTQRSFSFDNDIFEYNFAFRVVNSGIDMSDVSLEGEILVVTADNVTHKIGTWSKSRSGSSNITYSVTDDKYGRFEIYKSGDGHVVELLFIPKPYYGIGVKCILMRHHITHKKPWDSGWMEYEKEIPLNTIFSTYSPMPALSFEWTDDGLMVAKGTNVYDKRNSNKYFFEGYGLNIYSWYDTPYVGTITHDDIMVMGDAKCTRRDNGRMDIEYTFRPMYFGDSYYGSYTSPILIKTEPSFHYYDIYSEKVYNHQPVVESVVLPFTRPEEVRVAFDKWNKKNTVTWTRRSNATGPFGRSYQCRTEGKWYVIRYEKGTPPENYTLVGSIDGDATNLSVVDATENLEYEKEYIYRVVFLPFMLVDRCKDHLTDMPLHEGAHNRFDLWEQCEASTKLEMPITLKQDRTYDKAVRLMWEYCVQPSGENWSVETSPNGENSWRVLDSSLNVDATKSTASFDADGSVCDVMYYRVKTKYAGKDFYSNVIPANLPSGSYISEVTASTGIYEKTVEVKWKVMRADINNDIYYRVLRRPIGTETWTLLTDEIHGMASEYIYTDDRPLAGSYYEYTVEAYAAKCDEQLIKTDQVITPGFSQARGTITGHIAYGTGTAVVGARVNLIKSSADDETDQPQYLSRYIEGEGKGLQWLADSAKYVNVLDGTKPLTLQFWVRPQPVEGGGANRQHIVSLAGAIELGAVSTDNEHFNLYAVDYSSGNPSMIDFPRLMFDDFDFTHVTATYDNGKWTFYVGTKELRSASISAQHLDWNACKANRNVTLNFGGSNRTTGAPFMGYVDDIRLWNRALSLSEVETNHTRILGGTENGLILYWPLDEGLSVVKYAFDISRQDGIDQLNHPQVGVNAQPSVSVPQLLSLYGLTDAEGDYIIKGIPFQQGGTNYKLAPELGIHEFSPNMRSMFISPTSLTANNIDFEDVSSFPMEGVIYYAGTNIPAEGIQFYIDGQLVTAGGEVKQTDASGRYRISVPIGQHFVEAKLEGHKMVNGGRFPTQGYYNFNSSVTYDFVDSTLVNFVGRVSGGLRNDTLAVGFAESKNNIGMATIQLRLNNESLSFNCQDDHITSATSQRTWASDTTSIRSRSWTGTGDSVRYINIRTDSLTGEFSAMLPPLKYITKSIVIESDKEHIIEFNELPQIDLTNARKELTDSLKQEIAGGDSVWNKYKYHTKMIRTYFAPPKLDMVQKGNPAGAFGKKEITYTIDTEGTKATIGDLWQQDEAGNVSYQFNYPIYEMGDRQRFTFHGYEAYINRDSGKDVVDTIPLNNQLLIIGNEMSDEQKVVCTVEDESTGLHPGDIYNMVNNELTLDENGRAEMQWSAGAPNIVNPYTRHFSVTMERRKRTYVMAGLDAVVLGILTTGNNFVTQGPDRVQFVLRDPPGAKSKTTLKTGSVTTKTHYDTYLRYGDHSFVGNILAGSDLELGAGFGFIVITGNKAKSQTDVGYEAHWKYTHVKDTATVTTKISAISTSTSVPYVGGNGDVFVGTSNNILVGTCRKLYLKKDDLTGKYSIVLEDALAMGEEIATTFSYSAYELKTVMIPKWKDQRKQYLKRVATEDEAKAYVNTGKRCVWLTWLDPSDPKYGDDGTYVFSEPVKPEVNERDSVEICNIQIEKWEKVLRDNEEEKVKAIKTKSPTNFSIDGGSSRVMTYRDEIVKIDETKTVYQMGAVLAEHFGWSYKGAISFGCITNITSNEGGGETSGDGTKTDDYTEWEYTFNDGNRDVDISINQYDSDNKNHSKIFTVFGGQTYNPYEPPEVTEYYEPGTPLGNGTVQMEQPNLRIGIGDALPAESVTITDIPAGQTANLTLYCTNMANVHMGIDFAYDVVVRENNDTTGLEILMDGVPINGRSIRIPQGETVKKIITIRQSDMSILDHKGIRLRFCSQYQAPIIYDEVTINAHFKPSSSPVDLVIAEPVLNTQSRGGELDMKLTNFNRLFKNLKNVGVQYRFAGNTQWTDLHTWVTNKSDSTSTQYNMLPATGDLRYSLNMTDNSSYPEGTYEFRAYTTTPYDSELIHTYSDVVTVIKDLTRPRNLFTPAPSNGILGYGDQLSLEFNEDIVPGYVGDKNVIVTAKLNSQEVDHAVSLKLHPFGDQPETVNPVFLNGDFSIDFWLNWHGEGTVLHQGEDTSDFALDIDNDGHVVVRIAGAEFASSATLPKDEWIFFVLSYNASTMTFDMLAQYGTSNVVLFQNQPVTMQEVQAVYYSDDNKLYLGKIEAEIHSLSLYNIYRDVYKAGAEKYQAKDTYVYGLANHWPMDEGHGTTAADTRHTHDFSIPGQWNLENTNYSIRIDSNEGARIDIARLDTSPGDSYAIELWHDMALMAAEQVVFETATPTVDGDLLPQTAKLRLHYDAEKNLVLDHGTKSDIVASVQDFPDPSGWRHLALNVVRGQAASFYIDGQRTAVIAETDLPALQGTSLLIGINGDLSFYDELRIWHASLSESRLLANIYNTVDTADVYSRGLVAYYPFEQTGVVNGVTQKVPTLKNMARLLSGETAAEVTPADLIMPVKYAPPLKNAPDETRLIASPVASERKVVINLTGAGISPRDIEGTMLNVTVDQIHDLHGNTSLPIRWTAYVQQNTLKWTRDSVNIIKKYGDDYTFDVIIENRGGHTEYYTLYNMPQWLTLIDSDRTDDVAPLSSKTLRFRVDPLASVGNYDVTIGLKGNNDIHEPLRLVMKVRGEMPGWQVDPTQYEHLMTFIGQVRINGILMENAESRVAAFVDGECRGIASPEKVRGAAYITMPVYGVGYEDGDLGKPVTFRIWDASTGVAYTDVNITLPNNAATTPTFNPDEVIGDFDQPVIWTKGSKVEQNFHLNTLWNWMALGVRPDDLRPVAVFPDLTYWKTIIKDKTGTTVYSNGAEWRPNGVELQPAKMYKMKITAAANSPELPSLLAVSGQQLVLSETPVEIGPEWNWIAYTPLATMPIDMALAGANPQRGDRVKSQNGIAIYGPNMMWEGNLKALESGHGYMYYSTAKETKTFVYPNHQSNRAPKLSSMKISTPPTLFSPIDASTYPDNMTMVIQLCYGDAVIDSCEVAAFVEGECRGATRADEGLYYLVIAGEGSGQQLTLSTCFEDEIIPVATNLIYTSDANIGTPWEPYVIDLSTVVGISEIPSSDIHIDSYYDLQGVKHDGKPRRRGIYIRSGEKVVVK